MVSKRPLDSTYCYLILTHSVKRHAIDSLLNFAKHTPKVGIVAPRLLNADGSVQGSVYRTPSLWRAIRQYWLLQGPILDKYSPNVDKPIEVEAVVGAAMLITPAARASVGLLDEKYFMYFEDLDYCRRMLGAGFKIYFLPSSEVVHLQGASGKMISAENNQWRRLIPSSKIYHGLLSHTLITFVIWSGTKWQRILGKR